MRPFVFAAMLGCASMAAADAPEFTVYAPDYFASEWGPGPAIEAAFEKTCACDLVFVTGDLLPRLLLEGDRTKADVAIGFNTDVTARARASELFAPHGQKTDDLTMPVAWEDEIFLPFNWGYTAFVYDKTRLENPPQSFAELLEMPDDVQIVIQDPRASVSGLALVLWVKAVYGDEAGGAWERLSPKILTVTKGWSEAYGMFTSGEVDMVLSYTTSPAYHLIAEEDDSKAAAIFSEGHYFMVELAAKLKTTDQPELANAFMEFVLSETFQELIPTGNWAYPARLDPAKLPAEFAQLGQPDKAIFYSETEAESLRENAINEWLLALQK